MTDTHFNEPIDKNKPLSGTGREGYAVPPEVQQKVIDIIIEEARKMGFNNRDLAYYIAIAKRESSFNPDAANPNGTASGIAQVIDSTAATYGVNDSNRFDARSSIKAGLGYFRDLKAETIKDYGSAAGKFEPLIYYRYHYGEFSTRRSEKVPVAKGKGTRVVWHAKDFAELEQNKRYPDSKTVVDEAERIEAILNASHGLVIQLNDVMGKPMRGRKAIAVTKTPKPSGPPPAPTPASAPATVPASAPAAANASAPATVPATAPASAPESAPASAPAVAPATASATTSTSVPTTAADTPAAGGASPEQAAAESPAAASPAASVEWELHAQEVSTGADGKLPEISSDGQQAVMILIPRIDYEAYNNAVAKEGMPEDGNDHVLQPHDGETATPPPPPDSAPSADSGESVAAGDAAAPADPAAAATPEQQPAPAAASTAATASPATSAAATASTAASASAPAPATASVPVAAPPATAAAPTPPAAKAPSAKNVFDAAAQAAKDKATKRPDPGHDITFADIVTAIKKDLGWEAVYQTSFAYIKQFYTRPRMPAAPLDNSAPAAPGPARKQVIGSSLPNKEARKPKVEDKVQTAAQPAVKPVAVSGDASWMPIANKEQGKDGADKVTEKAGNQRNDPKWKEQHAARDAARKAEKTAQSQLRVEKAKKTPDSAKLAALQAQIDQQRQAAADADAAMLKIEQDYNNPDIVKYLQSTTLDRDMARNDDTAWCSSFTNWCMEQAGYIGTDNALAESWKDWGEELTEPRYGAITVVTRAANPTKYHVGFYIGMGEKSVPDGEEVVEVKAKDGSVSKKTKKKFKKVKAVRLLSGNYSNMIKEDTAWTVDADDSPERHLVSYRWPTAKEKR